MWRLAVLALALWPALAGAQDAAQTAWRFIDPLARQGLDIRPGEGPAELFPDNMNPAAADVALGFHYYGNRVGGNAVMLNVGLFHHIEGGWVFAGPVEGLYGTSPREARFFPGRVEITTTMLGPNEPRCCPTQVTRWSVDTITRQVTRLP
ncbi:hypothetical protein ACP2AV_05605 [Aliiroseovarius sp. PTFE2010]|uniref:hypothetical protein n=1 Tax=Aliiroseovarius sp. PTFE2010 TaxID=3417190 RepID=UPI003CF27914